MDLAIDRFIIAADGNSAEDDPDYENNENMGCEALDLWPSQGLLDR